MMNKSALDIFHAALGAVNPYDAVLRHMDRIVALYQDGGFQRLYVLGIGKAAFPMMQAAAAGLGERITKGVLLTKYGHSSPNLLPTTIQIYEAGHPVPDEKGLRATLHIKEMLDSADEQTLVLCLLSGGASALLVSPLEGVSLEDKQQVTQQLLKSGADIVELNAVRKHLSQVKGGRLAQHAVPARVVSLVLSDVIGDRLDVIASGPFAPDASTYAEALAVIRKYGPEDETPRSVMKTLYQGLQGELPETPKEGDSVFLRTETAIIGSNCQAAEAARKRAVELGFEAVVLGCDFRGAAADVGRFIVRQALAARQELHDKNRKKICLIAGGETTVHVIGNGLGGRNMEMALVVAMELEGVKGVTFLSAGTDGTDGPTDAAGALVDGNTMEEARRLRLDPAACLANNDSYPLFKSLNRLVMTGPTGTNVMDIYLALIECNDA